MWDQLWFCYLIKFSNPCLFCVSSCSKTAVSMLTSNVVFLCFILFGGLFGSAMCLSTFTCCFSGLLWDFVTLPIFSPCSSNRTSYLSLNYSFCLHHCATVMGFLIHPLLSSMWKHNLYFSLGEKNPFLGPFVIFVVCLFVSGGDSVLVCEVLSVLHLSPCIVFINDWCLVQSHFLDVLAAVTFMFILEIAYCFYSYLSLLFVL